MYYIIINISTTTTTAAAAAAAAAVAAAAAAAAAATTTVLGGISVNRLVLEYPSAFVYEPMVRFSSDGPCSHNSPKSHTTTIWCLLVLLRSLLRVSMLLGVFWLRLSANCGSS